MDAALVLPIGSDMVQTSMLCVTSRDMTVILLRSCRAITHRFLWNRMVSCESFLVAFSATRLQDKASLNPPSRNHSGMACMPCCAVNVLFFLLGRRGKSRRKRRLYKENNGLSAHTAVHCSSTSDGCRHKPQATT